MDDEQRRFLIEISRRFGEYFALCAVKYLATTRPELVKNALVNDALQNTPASPYIKSVLEKLMRKVELKQPLEIEDVNASMAKVQIEAEFFVDRVLYKLGKGKRNGNTANTDGA